MKLNYVYKLFVLIALALVFQSRSGGPGSVAELEVSGAPGSTGDMGTCGNSGCHTEGAFNPSMEIIVTDPNTDMPVTEYVPEKEYWVEFRITTTSGSPERYGFQGLALDDNNDIAGTWQAPFGAQTTELNGRTYIEHSVPFATSFFLPDWVAPASGTGNITFYAAGLASNNNGGATGDGVANTSKTFSEMGSSAIDPIDLILTAIKVAPNPVKDLSKLTITSQVSGDFKINIVNVNGQRVFHENVNLIVGENEKILHLGDLQGGLYFLQLIGKEGITTKQIIKL